jgi:hypothetical protein
MFKKGEPRAKGAGKKKGSKHKKTLLKVEEYLAQQNIHPVQKILDLMPSLQPSDQLEAWLNLMKYWVPVIKPVEATPAPNPQQTNFQSIDNNTLKVISSQ